jgi:hypothetical protein
LPAITFIHAGITDFFFFLFFQPYLIISRVLKWQKQAPLGVKKVGFG